MVPSRIRFHYIRTGTPDSSFLILCIFPYFLQWINAYFLFIAQNGPERQAAWFQPSCVPLGKLLNLSVLRFALLNSQDSICLLGLLRLTQNA